MAVPHCMVCWFGLFPSTFNTYCPWRITRAANCMQNATLSCGLKVSTEHTQHCILDVEPQHADLTIYYNDTVCNVATCGN